MTVLDSDIPNLINTMNVCVARLKQARSIDMSTEKADGYIDDVITDLDGMSDWFMARLNDAQHMEKIKRKIKQSKETKA